MATVKALAQTVSALSTEQAVHSERIKTIQEQIETQDYTELLQRLAVLESQVSEIKKTKDESEKRQWQLVYLFVGMVFTLISTALVQLLLALIKKS